MTKSELIDPRKATMNKSSQGEKGKDVELKEDARDQLANKFLINRFEKVKSLLIPNDDIIQEAIAGYLFKAESGVDLLQSFMIESDGRDMIMTVPNQLLTTLTKENPMVIALVGMAKDLNISIAAVEDEDYVTPETTKAVKEIWTGVLRAISTPTANYPRTYGKAKNEQDIGFKGLLCHSISSFIDVEEATTKQKWYKNIFHESIMGGFQKKSSWRTILTSCNIKNWECAKRFERTFKTLSNLWAREHGKALFHAFEPAKLPESLLAFKAKHTKVTKVNKKNVKKTIPIQKPWSNPYAFTEEADLLKHLYEDRLSAHNVYIKQFAALSSKEQIKTYYEYEALVKESVSEAYILSQKVNSSLGTRKIHVLRAAKDLGWVKAKKNEEVVLSQTIVKHFKSANLKDILLATKDWTVFAPHLCFVNIEDEKSAVDAVVAAAPVTKIDLAYKKALDHFKMHAESTGMDIRVINEKNTKEGIALIVNPFDLLQK